MSVESENCFLQNTIFPKIEACLQQFEFNTTLPTNNENKQETEPKIKVEEWISNATYSLAEFSEFLCKNKSEMLFITSPYSQSGLMTSRQVFQFDCYLEETQDYLKMYHYFPNTNISAIQYENVPSLLGYQNLSSLSSYLIFNRSNTNS